MEEWFFKSSVWGISNVHFQLFVITNSNLPYHQKGTTPVWLFETHARQRWSFPQSKCLSIKCLWSEYKRKRIKSYSSYENQNKIKKKRKEDKRGGRVNQSFHEKYGFDAVRYDPAALHCLVPVPSRNKKEDNLNNYQQLHERRFSWQLPVL